MKQNEKENTSGRQQARRQLAAEVEQLLSRTPADGLHWQGTKTDLMEALHVVYLTGSVLNPDGRSVTFQALVARVCRVLHVTPPANPYAYATRASLRKGIYQSAFLERYCHMLYHGGLPRPLHQQLLLS